MIQYLLHSTHWEKMWKSEGSILFSLQEDNLISTFTKVEGENMRIDPWAEFRSLDHFNWRQEIISFRGLSFHRR